jgi:cell wall-associated NlpC family hydrolase
MIGQAIASEAENWLGVPFHWQGRNKAGCDCKGLIAGVARECGRPEADSLEAMSANYSTRVNTKDLLAGLKRMFDRADDVQAGDILLLNVKGSPQHMAIAVPIEGQPMRAIQAIHTGPMRVVATRIPKDMVHSIWRWRE